MESNEDDEVRHIGIKRRSGRYPWGSGRGEVGRARGFKAYYEDLKRAGLTDTEIAESVKMHIKDYHDALEAAGGTVKNKRGESDFSTTDLRAGTAISTEVLRAENVNMAVRLKEKDMSTVAIAERMGLGKSGESTVRGWLKASEEIKANSLRATANRLKEEVQEKSFLDVGKGQHLYMGITDNKLRTAVAMLRDEGYELHTNIKLPQLGTDKMTTYKVLAKPGTPWIDSKNAVVNGELKTIAAQSDDGGHTYSRPPKSGPVSVDLKRVAVKWKEDGGEDMDGVIELRRGVEDLSLNGKNYAQVRVAVNGTHYMKGMAMYADDMPPGVDVRFNSNKNKSDPKVIKEGESFGDVKLGAMKPLKEDKTTGKVDADNPFGANTKPRLYVDKNGKEKASPLNLVNEEGKWDDWSRSLSSQMLSKQSLTLASTQLNKAQVKREDELKRIKAMTNPVVKEKLLHEFAESADSAAVHLKAAAIDRQATSVILPLTAVRPHEVYAPSFKQGEKVALVRHPHGGPFEIPELTVNNYNRQGKRLLAGALDAIGIHPSVAAQLSGADFDGDTVLVLPNDNRKIKTRPPLEGLKGFDAKVAYPEVEGMRVMSKKDTQREMGRISNLITDMTIHNAPDDDIARAVRHSMVVIDAEKHKLNYKLSEQVNSISSLKAKYQGGANRGAATIISRAGKTERIDKRKQLSGNKGIDPKTGEKVFVETGQSYQRPIRDKNGNPTGEFETVKNKTKGTLMEFTKDARELLSGGKPGDKVTPERGQPMERIYADYANNMKRLANEARKEQVSLKMPLQSKTAKSLYAKEIESLNTKLKTAEKNAPLERRAQSIANASARGKIEANPGYDKDDIKKIQYQALEEARKFVGADKVKVNISDREWDAVQAGAVASTTLRAILRNADMDRVRELATPRPRTALTPGQLARAKQMQASGRSATEIAELLDLPRSTVVSTLKNS